MGSPTVLGVELRDVEDDCVYCADTPVGSVAVYLVERESPAVAWAWDLSAHGETLLRGYGVSDTIEAACADADAQLSRLLAIGRAQGLREAAGICERRAATADKAQASLRRARATTVMLGAPWVLTAASAEITAAAEKAERGE